MARSDGLKMAVETQSGQCRILASALRTHVENAVLIGEADRKILLGFAEQLEGIAIGLVETVADADQTRLRRLWQMGASVTGKLASSAAIGAVAVVSGDLVTELLADAPREITECATKAHSAFVEIDLDRAGIADLRPTRWKATRHGAAQVGTSTGTGHNARVTTTAASGIDPGTGRRLEEIINDVVGIDDSVVKGLAEAAASSIDLDGPVADLAATVRGAVDVSGAVRGEGTVSSAEVSDDPRSADERAG